MWRGLWLHKSGSAFSSYTTYMQLLVIVLVFVSSAFQVTFDPIQVTRDAFTGEVFCTQNAIDMSLAKSIAAIYTEEGYMFYLARHLLQDDERAFPLTGALASARVTIRTKEGLSVLPIDHSWTRRGHDNFRDREDFTEVVYIRFERTELSQLLRASENASLRLEGQDEVVKVMLEPELRRPLKDFVETCEQAK